MAGYLGSPSPKERTGAAMSRWQSTFRVGQDQKAYILSVNINRRHMTAAQRAMATAMIYPVAPRGRGKKDEAKPAAAAGFSERRLRDARAVLAHSPPIAAAVLAGSKSLDEAYNEVKIAGRPRRARFPVGAPTPAPTGITHHRGTVAAAKRLLQARRRRLHWMAGRKAAVHLAGDGVSSHQDFQWHRSGNVSQV